MVEYKWKDSSNINTKFLCFRLFTLQMLTLPEAPML